MLNKSNLRSRTLIVSAAAALLFLIMFVGSRSITVSRADAVASTTTERASDHGDSQKRNEVSDSPAVRELGRNIDRAIDESVFSKARWGVFVMNRRDGKVLYARNGDRSISPASNMKIYTTGVALDLLGRDYRWRTTVYAENAPDSKGAVAGDLVLMGRGAPDLSSSKGKNDSESSLDELADAVYERGVRHVSGDLIGDESYFRGDALGDGWLWNDVQWYFGAEVSALSINGNQMDVAVAPSSKAGEKASVTLKGGTRYFEITNDTSTADRGVPATIGITRGLSDNNVRVWGEFPLGGRALDAHLSVHQPALWAATLFREALEARGITIEGKIRSVDSRENETDEGMDRKRQVELASVNSQTLADLARLTNKESINLYAELILRTLGKERGATAPDADPKKMRSRGDDEAGVAVIRSWLDRHQLPTESLSLHDGSGLSRLDLVTPEATARLLASISQTPVADLFRETLPVAGRDGTLKFRLRGRAAGRIMAKTGTVAYVNSLSGYATTADDEQIVFSIICNDETSKGSSIQVIDKIADLLVSFSASPT
ncbi:MAG: hypothetical protein QOJ64_3211 [Acidobacteriota bacterium]|jgi:D-alanyl-D-alanine carboxypeptidase/D-alanyl-D-alanine-endopeptidase (penicillin-binding protein 4)|nr:hypothetical protein [Acidobacteriota bacterium]